MRKSTRPDGTRIFCLDRVTCREQDRFDVRPACKSVFQGQLDNSFRVINIFTWLNSYSNSTQLKRMFVGSQCQRIHDGGIHYWGAPRKEEGQLSLTLIEENEKPKKDSLKQRLKIP